MKRDQPSATKEKDNRRRDRFWKHANPLVEKWLSSRFDFSHDDFDPGKIDGPVIVVINHASAYDPIFVGVAFRKKRLSFIASEHILRNPKFGPLLSKYISIIPHQKGARGSRTALVALKRIKKGESIFLAAEGEQTWDGKPMPVMPYTGKMIKGSGATLVNYRIDGAYLAAPRWSFETRKGKVYGHAAGVYSPDELKGMSDEEVERLIARDLGFDVWAWQRSQPEGPHIYKCRKGGNADGLERAVFTCPDCGSIGSLRSEGDYIDCSCGFRLRLADTGFFESCEGGNERPRFETVADWMEFDRLSLEKRLKSISEVLRSSEEDQSDRNAATEIFADEGVTLVGIEDGHTEQVKARDRLILEYKVEKQGEGAFVMSIGEYSFDLKSISNMTMVLAARIVFSDRSGYYELRSEKGSRTNLIKYVIARKNVRDGC